MSNLILDYNITDGEKITYACGILNALLTPSTVVSAAWYSETWNTTEFGILTALVLYSCCWYMSYKTAVTMDLKLFTREISHG